MNVVLANRDLKTIDNKPYLWSMQGAGYNFGIITSVMRVVMMLIIQGVTAVEPKYTTSFHDIGPLAISPRSSIYLDVANWTGIAIVSLPCQDFGFNNPKISIYISTYNISARRKAYDLFALAISGADNPYYSSIFMFEDYASSGVHNRDSSPSAFGFRNDDFLSAPLIIYNSTGRDIFFKDSEGLGNIKRLLV